MIGSWPPVDLLPRQAPGVTFVGQADYISALRDRVKTTHESKDFPPLDEQSRALHGRALEAFSKIEEEHPQMLPLLAQYCETVEAADLRSAADALAGVKGTEQIVHVARGNFLKQADRLLVGASEVIKEGKAVVTNFGTDKSFDSIEQIQQALNEIYQDFREVRYLFEDHVAGRYQGNVTSDMFSRLEKYMFDGKNLEKERGKSVSTLIITRDEEPEFTDMLRHEQIIASEARIRDATHQQIRFKDGDVATITLPTHATRVGLSARIDMANEGDRETGNIFLAMGDIPQTVIVHVPSKDSFSSIKGDHYAYQYLFIDWFRLPYKDRPRVIMYADGFTPQLYIKHSYQGFLFCSTPDELRNVVTLSNQLAQEQARELYNPESLSLGQKEAYDNSDLREWENKTADTFQSLNHLLHRFNHRNKLYQQYREVRYSGLFKTDDSRETTWLTGKESGETPTREVRTILDLGTGEGRISGMLARLGFNVIGLDISPEQLARSRERIREEGEGLRGEKHHAGLSYHALRRLQELGRIPPPNLSDTDTASHFLPVQGSFFELQYVLNEALNEWHERYPDIDPYAFFNASPYNEYAFSDARNMFADVGFDVAMFNWHTFCEVGSPENQKNVLEQILNVLDRGGEFVLEIPDRNIEPYASALRAYHAAHPDEPYGTIRDPKPEGFQGLEGQDLYPPRYFPDINELTLLLKSVGFEIDPKRDIQSYMIERADPKTGEKSLTLKEHFITARKSKR